MSNPKKLRNKCPICAKEAQEARGKYCSNACQIEYQHQAYITRWKAGEVSGLNSIGLVSPYIKKYLRRKFKNQCCFCGWSKTNPITEKVPLVADHIDGNWRNNIEKNLRLICPNCDALNPTFAALNKGRGRYNRAPSRRAQEGRLLSKNMPE